MPLTVTHHAAASRFEGVVQGVPSQGIAQAIPQDIGQHAAQSTAQDIAQDSALCSYRRVGDVLVLHHTEVPPALQGRGLAGELVRAVLAWARAQGLRVRPTCSYVSAYMRRHPETQDLLESPGDHR